MAPRRPLVVALRRLRPDLDDVEGAIVRGEVLVDGVVVTNPRSQVLPSAAIVVRPSAPLRGQVKLAAALDTFAVTVHDVVALDCGAAAGGFTTELLARGARRVYAVDAGYGQLLGSLRHEPRVVNLEATNLADLSAEVVPEPVDLVCLDLSYLSLAEAVPQLDRVPLAVPVQLVALVKPMFELHLPSAPKDPLSLDAALAAAVAGVEAAGWTVSATTPSPVTGARGAPELFLLAARPRAVVDR